MSRLQPRSSSKRPVARAARRVKTASLTRPGAAALLFAQLSTSERDLLLRTMWRMVPRSGRSDATLAPAARYAPPRLAGLRGRS